MPYITGIAHVNITVPKDTLHLAQEFYEGTLGFTSVPVPVLQRGTLAWFDITPSGQQIHVAFPKNSNDTNHPDSSRHICFHLPSIPVLEELKTAIFKHFEKGGESAPLMADKPGEADSGAKGVEYKPRFFARDYAGNRLEFSI